MWADYSSHYIIRSVQGLGWIIAHFNVIFMFGTSKWGILD